MDSQSPDTGHNAGLIWALLLAALLVRMPGLTRPLVGNFATKNAAYAMIARNWAEGRASLWRPTVDCLTAKGRGWHLLELPVSAYLTACGWIGLGGSLDVWGRATAVVLSAGAAGLLFGLVRRRHGLSAGLAAGAALALSPVAIVYGQSFMLEASLVFFIIAAWDSLDRYLGSGRRHWLVLASVWLALALLTKIYVVVFLLPLGWMAWQHRTGCGRTASPDPDVGGMMAAGGASARGPSCSHGWGLLALGLAVLPAAWWYASAYRAADPRGAEAGHIFYSVRESTAVHRPPHPLLGRPAFYRRLLDDLAGVVLTPVGFALLLLGAGHARARQYALWFVACGLLIVLLPLKFFEMNYYYVPLLPPLCVVVGLGWQVVWLHIRPRGWWVTGLAAVALLFALRYAAGPAFVTPPEDRAVVAAGQALRGLSEADEPVVAMHGSAIDLLYYCDRAGWAIDPRATDLHARLAQCQARGARCFVVAGPEADQEELWRGFRTLQRGDGYRVGELLPGGGESPRKPKNSGLPSPALRERYL